jgi:HSP20 family protein
MSTSLTVKPSSSGSAPIELRRRQNILEEMEALSNRIAQRAFDLFQIRGGFDGYDLDDWFRAESELLKPVPIEMSESPESYTIHADVPGFDAKDLTVQAEPTVIYIRGKNEHKMEEKNGAEVKYSEVSANDLARRIDLPASINPEKATAKLANGVLELTLPKSSVAKKVDVKVA